MGKKGAGVDRSREIVFCVHVQLPSPTSLSTLTQPEAASSRRMLAALVALLLCLAGGGLGLVAPRACTACPF
jgi:hypothetical protein